jgi:hypothetical protein
VGRKTRRSKQAEPLPETPSPDSPPIPPQNQSPIRRGGVTAPPRWPAPGSRETESNAPMSRRTGDGALRGGVSNSTTWPLFQRAVRRRFKIYDCAAERTINGMRGNTLARSGCRRRCSMLEGDALCSAATRLAKRPIRCHCSRDGQRISLRARLKRGRTLGEERECARHRP